MSRVKELISRKESKNIASSLDLETKNNNDVDDNNNNNDDGWKMETGSAAGHWNSNRGIKAGTGISREI